MSSQGLQVARGFYEAFARRDASAMGCLYADDATFSDPVFRDLGAAETRAMWDMMCKNGRDLRVEFSVLEHSDTHARVEWVAHYTFSKTGRPVRNRIDSRLELRDGKIIAHRDVFDFHAWARQAFGAVGLMLGWTPFFLRKVRDFAYKGLAAHQRRH
jgi:ketosteroid isomerase-like protein